jgi:hypothetical protein
MSEDTPKYDIGPQPQLQGFGFVPSPTWFSIIFNYKTLSIVAMLGLSAAVYVLNLQKDNLQLQLDNTELIISNLKEDNKRCQVNYDKLSNTVTEAAEATVAFNIEIQDLRTQVEKYNKINGNNTNIIKQLNEDKFAETCEEGISELVESF